MVQTLLPLESEFHSIFGKLLTVLAGRGKTALHAPMLEAWVRSSENSQRRKQSRNKTAKTTEQKVKDSNT